MRVGEYDLSPDKEGEADCDTDGWCAPLPQVTRIIPGETNMSERRTLSRTR